MNEKKIPNNSNDISLNDSSSSLIQFINHSKVMKSNKDSFPEHHQADIKFQGNQSQEARFEEDIAKNFEEICNS